MSSSSAHFLADRRIAVAGASMAGLAFAIALVENSKSEAMPQLVLFDRDPRVLPSDRQGYSMSINGTDENGGLVALQRLGLLDRAMAKANQGVLGKSFKMWDGNWTELIAMALKPYGDLPLANIRIPRSNLRNVLIEEAERLDIDIRWEAQVLGVERLDDGKMSLSVKRTDTEMSLHTCDILIAADGAHSKVRSSLRPSDDFQYAGVVQFGGVATFSEGIPPPLNDAWGLVVTGKGNSCFCSPVEDTTLVWGVSKMVALSEASRPRTQSDREALLNEAETYCAAIAEPFATLIKATDASSMFAIPAMDKQPFSHEDVAPGVVFIGDSNHAVSPWAGNGANMALQDGLNLAELLCSSESLSDARAAYDKVAVPRAQQTLKSSHWRMWVAHLTGFSYFLLRCLLRVGVYLM